MNFKFQAYFPRYPLPDYTELELTGKRGIILVLCPGIETTFSQHSTIYELSLESNLFSLHIGAFSPTLIQPVSQLVL